MLFRYFIRELDYRRWSIVKNKNYSGGSFFYWVCDFSYVKEVLDYDSSINTIKLWAQDIIGYQFLIIHHSHKIVKDVDALNSFYEP